MDKNYEKFVSRLLFKTEETAQQLLDDHYPGFKVEITTKQGNAVITDIDGNVLTSITVCHF